MICVKNTSNNVTEIEASGNHFELFLELLIVVDCTASKLFPEENKYEAFLDDLPNLVRKYKKTVNKVDMSELGKILGRGESI